MSNLQIRFSSQEDEAEFEDIKTYALNKEMSLSDLGKLAIRQYINGTVLDQVAKYDFERRQNDRAERAQMHVLVDALYRQNTALIRQLAAQRAEMKAMYAQVLATNMMVTQLVSTVPQAGQPLLSDADLEVLDKEVGEDAADTFREGDAVMVTPEDALTLLEQSEQAVAAVFQEGDELEQHLGGVVKAPGPASEVKGA